MAYSLNDLINDSIKVIPGMIAVYPQFSQEEVINVNEISSKFPGRYAANNSTIGFILGKNFFVTPYTRSAMTVLAANGFKEASFNVPFSNWDYPKSEQFKWNALLERARQERKADFVSDCEAYCDAHHIGSIRQEILANCFEMPESGVRVKHLYFEDTYYPVMHSGCSFDNLGHFCCNNGRVVFVYRNGATYVAKGYKILAALRAAGYTESGLFVPFSNGEEIQDYDMRERWDAIRK